MRRVLIAAIAFAATLASQVPSNLFDGLRWRLIGPFRGGRTVTAAGIPGDPNTYYFGAVGGGIWKTTDGGMVWTPIFDDQHVASIGAIALAPSNPNIIYAGTGEADIRSSLSSGDGVYKSTDAGKTWRHAGLRDTKQIGTILVDPKNPDIVFVAALGHAYGPNLERGVYRSRDGGRSWQKVLDKGPEIGAVDLAFAPEDSQVIYATTWQTFRPPWSQYGPVEKPGGGLFKSTDGGDHWSQVTGHGLPAGGWKRSGVAVARGTGGRRVYALIDSANGNGLYRSDDSGATWTRPSSDTRINARSWYFGSVTVDPNNPDIVYLPNTGIFKTEDGGKTFTVFKGAPGGDDYHYLWIDPNDSRRMIQAADQGATITVDDGKTWGSWYNQPTAQFYHVVTDNQFPYHVYGSQQDSGTVALPSRTDHGFITEYDRANVGDAESGYIMPDPQDPNISYVSNTYGGLKRFDKRTSQGQIITPWPAPAFGLDISQRKYRFPWTAPLVFSPVDHALYYGAQYVLKTTDGGLNWQEISPDLTGADKNMMMGEVTVQNAKLRGYGVIYSIAPSPTVATEVWAGSDTGLIHLTRDGGKTWANVTPPELGDWSKITHIEASRFHAGTAFAAVDRHRLDDYQPYLFRTRDYGKTWTRIVDGIAPGAFLNAVREDPERAGLLYAATESGVYVSFDEGDHWESLQLNLPPSSVRDLVIHQDDLVIATFGRGFWILDDMTPLRQIDRKIASAPAFLYKPAVAIRMNRESFQGTPLPPEIPKAPNPPDGAVLDYYLQSEASEVTLEILDSQNQIVRRFSSNDPAKAPRTRQAIADIWIVPPPHLSTRAGMNRFVWDLRYSIAAAAGEADDENGMAAQGPQVLPGMYQVRLNVAGQQYTQPLKVVLDPRSSGTPSDLSAQLELSLKVARQIAKCVQLTRLGTSLREQLSAAKKTSDAALLAQIVALESEVDRIFGVAGGWDAPASASGVGAILTNLSAINSVLDSADRMPPAPAHALYDQASEALATNQAEWEMLKNGKLADLNRTLRAKNLKEIH
ncbi:MAG TPA: hypothetical protein VKT81_24555 [Bryobacteraceae bacterium]|nr:hypothetical protein [Bryobacteraceae bacterium]